MVADNTNRMKKYPHQLSCQSINIKSFINDKNKAEIHNKISSIH